MLLNMQEIVEKVKIWVQEHQEEMIKDIIQLVNIRSVSEPGEGGYAFGTGCKDCADLFMKLGQSYGFLSENDDYYCASVLMPGEKKDELGILGHLDIVPEGDGWHYEPFDAVEHNGYIVGRGAGDNKGAVVMSLYAMRCIKDMGIQLKHTLRLIGGCNEEAGMKDVEHYLQGHVPPRYTIVCDGGWAMCVGEKGILQAELTQKVTDGNLLNIYGGIASNSVPAKATAVFSDVSSQVLDKVREKRPEVEIKEQDGKVFITVYGKAAHAFQPFMGDNAIYKLLRVIGEFGIAQGSVADRLEALSRCFVDDYGTGLHIDFKDDISGPTTCIGGMIRYHQGVLKQNINVRFSITQNSDELVRQMVSRCEGLGIAVEDIEYSQPRYTSLKEPIPQMLLDTCQELLEERYEPYVMGGGTHARKFPNALPYGPNVMSGFVNEIGEGHGIDEAVYIKHLTQTIPVYVVALMKLDDYFNNEDSPLG